MHPLFSQLYISCGIKRFYLILFLFLILNSFTVKRAFLYTPRICHKRGKTHSEFPGHCQTSSKSTLEFPPRMKLQLSVPVAHSEGRLLCHTMQICAALSSHADWASPRRSKGSPTGSGDGTLATLQLSLWIVLTEGLGVIRGGRKLGPNSTCTLEIRVKVPSK